MRGFYKQLPKFQNVSTYITTESYGGKMGADFALVWDQVSNIIIKISLLSYFYHFFNELKKIYLLAKILL